MAHDLIKRPYLTDVDDKYLLLSVLLGGLRVISDEFVLQPQRIHKEALNIQQRIPSECTSFKRLDFTKELKHLVLALATMSSYCQSMVSEAFAYIPRMAHVLNASRSLANAFHIDAEIKCGTSLGFVKRIWPLPDDLVAVHVARTIQRGWSSVNHNREISFVFLSTLYMLYSWARAWDVSTLTASTPKVTAW
jgi:hypothetical protein